MTLIENMFRKFRRNERGTVMIEMIVLLPLLILWMVGSNSFFDGFKTYLRASKATYTTVDLISRQDVVGPNYMKNIGTIFSSIVDADGTSATVVVSSVKKVNGVLKLDWSLNGSGTVGLTNASQIPTAYVPNLVNGEYVIIVQSRVPYIPIYSWGNLKAKTFTNTLAVTPRFDVRVALDPNM